MEGKYISLITFKKDGGPIATPVWFYEENDKMYVITSQRRYKVKRIQNNPNVEVAKSSLRGKAKASYQKGTARILDDSECKRIENLFKTKYFSSKLMFRKERKGDKKNVCLEITLNQS